MWAPSTALNFETRVTLGTFAWMIAWWMAQPVPWAISSLLPCLILPLFRVTAINDVFALYGQGIFFWIWGTILMGYAMDRHGLAKRFALWFLSLRIVSGNTHRLVFGFMLVTAIISSHISDAATVAMMIPVGVSLAGYVRSVAGLAPTQKSNLGALLALGAMYASAAGGLATIAGVPYSALSISLLENFTGRTLGWFNWMLAGVPVSLTSLVVFYFLLRRFLPPEITSMPGGREHLLRERAKLGPISRGEIGTLFVFLTMVILFISPPLIRFLLGAENPAARWVGATVSIWIVPIVVLLLLFCTPTAWRKGEFLLSWREAVAHSPWSIMILCTAAVAMTDQLVEFGFVELAGGFIGNLGMGPTTLPFVAAYLMGFGTNLFSGTAATTFLGSILIPASQQVGFNPASMAMIIPNLGVGLMVPWSGAVAGAAFATGEIEMRMMLRIGAVATVLFAFLVAIIHILLAPIL